MTEDYRFIEWDYDIRVATEYKRRGECNGCGACCTGTIFFVADNNQKNWNAHNGYPTVIQEKGIVNEVAVNGKRRCFTMIKIEIDPSKRCPMLTAQNRCKIHEGKGLLSRAWPMSPRQVEPFSDCSYSFEIVRQWKF